MTENLDVNTFRNGDLILEAKTEEDWEEAGRNGIPAWCYYRNISENGQKYGKLYNWYVVNDKRGISPKNWHIPTLAEFEILEKVGCHYAGELSIITRNFPTIFSGMRIYDGSFIHLDEVGCFWSSTEDVDSSVYCIYLSKNGKDVSFEISEQWKNYGFSIRCLKD